MTENSGVAIDLEHVKKTFALGKRKVLEVLSDVTIHMEPGSFTSIIGQSGCGKSTLLKIVAALEKPTSGQVTFNGTVVAKPSVDVGVLF